MIARTITVTAEFTPSIISASATLTDRIITAAASLTTSIKHFTAEPYDGETTVTPSAETQTLRTGGTVLLDDIIINPIPSNYGLITWNGATLTVS
jgi:hypothetical protein